MQSNFILLNTSSPSSFPSSPPPPLLFTRKCKGMGSSSKGQAGSLHGACRGRDEKRLLDSSFRWGTNSSLADKSHQKLWPVRITYPLLAAGNSYNDAERCVCAGYDNGDIKLFDLRTMTQRWETNIKNGVSTPHIAFMIFTASGKTQEGAMWGCSSKQRNTGGPYVGLF